MLELSNIRENRDQVIERLKKRNIDAQELVDQIIDGDAKRRKLQAEVDEKKAEMNKLSKQIGQLFKEGKQDEANSAKQQTTALKSSIQSLDETQSHVMDELKELLYQLPNVPNEIVPKGNSDQDNEIVFENDIKAEPKEHKPHWDIAEEYGLIDFETGVKVTGAGFPIYKGRGAKLQRALINFFLNEAEEAGYEEHIPPHLVNEDSGYGTGQLPDKEGQMYHITEDDLYLIPTAEVPLTNMFRGDLLKEDQFPIKVTGYTPCFRREAGSYGKDVRGLNRLHQFDKVEIVQIVHPDKSYETLDGMVEYVKGLLNKLELPFRVAKLCGGDLGFTAALTYDMEVWSAAQQKWLEVSSISNFESFQANRLQLRFKDSDGKKQLAHTLNGSALALPRIVAAILENNQTEKGIAIPKALVPYTGFEYIEK